VVCMLDSKGLGPSDRYKIRLTTCLSIVLQVRMQISLGGVGT
jgi:hypothetical protein